MEGPIHIQSKAATAPEAKVVSPVTVASRVRTILAAFIPSLPSPLSPRAMYKGPRPQHMRAEPIKYHQYCCHENTCITPSGQRWLSTVLASVLQYKGLIAPRAIPRR